MACWFPRNILLAMSSKRGVKTSSLMRNRKLHSAIIPLRTYCGLTNPVISYRLSSKSMSFMMQAVYKSPSHFPNVRDARAMTSFQTQQLHSLYHQNNLLHLQQKRCFHNNLPKTQEHQDQHQKQKPEPPTFGEKMALRLVAENGFLSWTRNSYLCSAAGAAMLNGSDADLIQHAGVLALCVSGMNMAWGSACHFSNLISIRNHTTMSRPILLLNLLGTVLHAILWLFILGYFIKFSVHTCRKEAHKQYHHDISQTEQK